MGGAGGGADPHAQAIRFGGHEICYRDLDRASTRLARSLIDAGVGPGSVVALGMPRSVEYLIGLWAVTKTGAAFLPVDPAHPADRIAFMLGDSGAVLGLTVAQSRDVLPDAPGWWTLDAGRLTGDRTDVSPIRDTDRTAPLRLDQAAYLIYTSGSTGIPKGVTVTHRGLAAFAEHAQRLGRTTPRSRVLHATSPSFDASILEFLLAFGAGATLVIAPPTVYGGEELRDLLTAERVTHCFLTPTALAATDPGDLDDLLCVLTGGEACPPDVVARWAAGRQMYNAYGPTEATVAACISDPLIPGDPVTIGGPGPGFRVRVLDRRLAPVPVGVPGELYLAGPALARGYHRRPGLTAGRFVAEPGADPGDRMYRTGDVVCWTAAGRLVYLGRGDLQVKLRGNRIELGEVESWLTADGSVAQAVADVRAVGHGADRLVGYVVAAAGAAVDTALLHQNLAARLPGYMVPAHIVVLPELPMTVHGKLDRAALPTPDLGAEASVGRAPSGEVEENLGRLFAEVLGLDTVGMDDSFFALGGDSIMSIQLVARAKAAGLSLTPRDVFDHPTVAGLGSVADSRAAARPPTLEELPGGGVGEVPLTPILAWMLRRSAGRTDRFSQSVLLALPDGVDRAALEVAVQAVLDTHDMLRARLRRDGATESGWRMAVSGVGAVTARDVLTRVGVDSVDDAAFDDRAAAAADAAADRLDPAAGTMVQLVWFDGPSGAGRLLLVVHHAVVDGVSWRVLVSDLASAWAQASEGRVPALPPVGTSMRRWAFALEEVAAQRVHELPLWERILAGDDPTIGSRPLDPVRDVAATTEVVTCEAPRDVTAAVLTALPESHRAAVLDGLLTALTMAVVSWRTERGAPRSDVLLGVEGHGREESAVPGADLTRTVGWFTTLSPVRPDLSSIDLGEAFAGGAAAGAAVKLVKEQLRAIPDRGIGYGLLRGLTGEPGARVRGWREPQIVFNYLGRITAGAGDDPQAWLPTARHGLGGAHDPRMPVTAVVDVAAGVVPRPEGAVLQSSWTFPAGVLDADDVHRLAELWQEALRALAAYAHTPGAGGLTPSDVDLVPLDQAEIDALEARRPGLSDVWPLTPLQSGLLFHARLAERSVDAYTVQLVVELHGRPSRERMRRAGQALLDRHPNLRACFVEDDAGETYQVVEGRIPLPWSEIDLSGLDGPEGRERWRELLAADRATPFEMDRAPLLRFTLIRTGAQEHRLLLTHHHILLDGWSTPLLLEELLTLYAADREPRAPVGDYRDYLRWLAAQDHASGVEAWRRALAGADGPTLLVQGDGSVLAPQAPLDGVATPAEPGEVTLTLPVEETAALVATARDLGVTVNTVVQASWALVLGVLTGRTDVVFGATVSGRPPQVPGIESMIGLFINTVPVRIEFDPRDTVGELLSRVQAEQAALLDHHHIGLAEIAREAGPAATFDTLTVFESYPVDRSALARDTDVAGLRVAGVEGFDATHYPLTVLAHVDDRLRVTLKYRPDRLDPAEVEAIADRLRLAFAAVTHEAARPVASLDLLSATERDTALPLRGGA
ncbi:amino acid adenylation domain-containing protein, partial [Rhodococcus sp. NPDC059234]|uniref:amino acid adenylation domain-containing protein n=1 Tax=Rhodococcus sp. NPDC059234 TaxID=3346781 RepID=UPI0036723020